MGGFSHLKIYGNDYDTPDGTCIRDYTHIYDVARGTFCALKNLEQNPGLRIYNLGAGKGFSVLEIVEAFEKASGKNVGKIRFSL